MFKITFFKDDYKVYLKYCQITKKCFKYFKSIYSSTVYLDKPLMRVPISNIEKVVIGNNKIQKLKNFNIKVIIQVYIRFDESKIIKNNIFRFST